MATCCLSLYLCSGFRPSYRLRSFLDINIPSPCGFWCLFSTHWTVCHFSTFGFGSSVSLPVIHLSFWTVYLSHWWKRQFPTLSEVLHNNPCIFSTWPNRIIHCNMISWILVSFAVHTHKFHLCFICLRYILINFTFCEGGSCGLMHWQSALILKEQCLTPLRSPWAPSFPTTNSI